MVCKAWTNDPHKVKHRQVVSTRCQLSLFSYNLLPSPMDATPGWDQISKFKRLFSMFIPLGLTPLSIWKYWRCIYTARPSKLGSNSPLATEASMLKGEGKENTIFPDDQALQRLKRYSVQFTQYMDPSNLFNSELFTLNKVKYETNRKASKVKNVLKTSCINRPHD